MSPRGTEQAREPPGRAAPPEKRRPRKRRSLRRRLLRWLALGLLLGLGLAVVYVIVLSREIGRSFEGRLWTEPSRVYSAPLSLKIGDSVPMAKIQGRLERSYYTRITTAPRSPGQYRLAGSTLEVYAREFAFPGGAWPRRILRFSLEKGRLQSIQLLPAGRWLRQAQLEPEPLASFYGANREERTVLPLASFPEVLTQAVLASEDQRFFSHHGVDPLGILRALFQNLRTGSVVQGGSTITQQTVKNLYLSNERTMGRKVKEAVMAMILDARYPKERILEVYLNEIYLGQRGSVGICGFGEASRFYFGKEVSDVDLAEAAMLAGLIRAPAVNNPIAHPDRALARKNAVVQMMLDQGRIEPEEARRATQRKPAISKGLGGDRRAPYFIDEIRQELARGHSVGDLGENGLRIVTTLDPWMQEKAEGAIARGLSKIEKDRPSLARRRGGKKLEGCLVAMRPKTGEVLALVGGRSYPDSQFDRVTQAHRQPGSLFKPFVFATGFEKGQADTGEPFTPATILVDEPLTLTIAGREWSPHNYDEDYRGTVTAREALEGSINIPTVRAAMAIGLDRIVQTAEAAGMGRDLKAYPSIALGAQEVVPLEAAAAFAIFANGGRRPQPYTVTAVLNDEGKLVDEGTQHLTSVLSPQAAYVTLDLLRGVVNRGTAQSLRAHGIEGDFAGKTGTTNDKRDAWFIGFRPDLLTLVWVGFDDMAETGLTGAQGAVPIWEDFMKSIGEDDSYETFDKPDGIVWAEIDPVTGGLATEGCPETREEIFLESAIPEECTEHAGGTFRRFWRRFFGRRKSPIAWALPDAMFGMGWTRDAETRAPGSGDLA